MHGIKFIRSINKLPAQITAASLDFPLATKSSSCEVFPVRVAGWFVTDVQNVRLLLVQSTGEEFYISRAAIRRDVLKKVCKILDPTDDEARVGFNCVLQQTSGFDLYLEIENQRYLWAEIEVAGSLVESIESIWSSYHNSEEFIIPNELRAVAADARKILSSSLVIKHSTDSALSSMLSSVQRESFNKFLLKVDSGEYLLEIASSLESGTVSSPVSNSRAKICRSFLRGAVNYVQVRDGCNIFYFIQHITSVDALYLPSLNLFVVIGAAGKDEFERLVDGVFDLISRQVKEDAKFGGYHIGFPRPYHLMYDLLPAFDFCYRLGLIGAETKTYAPPTGCFVDVGEIYSLREKTSIIDWPGLNEKLYAQGSYLLKLGIYFNRGARKPGLVSMIVNLDERLLSHASEKYKLLPPAGIERLGGCSPLLWIGVTGQKRSWLEQIDGYVDIINSLAIKHNDIGIVFDGWTSSLESSVLDQQESDADESIVSAIRNRIDSRVPSISLVGKSLLEKVYVASRINLFIANGLTGSLYVSRVCRKPGVVHMSADTYDAVQLQYVHFNTWFVDRGSVVDVPHEEHNRCDYTSYSIAPARLGLLVEQVIEEIDSKDRVISRNLRDLFQGVMH